jgi:hypothetical protein
MLEEKFLYDWGSLLLRLHNKETEAENELSEGIIKMAVFFKESRGIPLELFQDKINQWNLGQMVRAYLNFKKKYPKSC